MKCRLVVSIDTEEDIWGSRSTAPITCANAKELPRLARFFTRLRVRPTFFVSYRMLHDSSSRAVIKELASEDGFEMGCHVHPWNTPPYDESRRHTVLHNYARPMQASKIANATRLFEDAFEHSPTVFRAGRFGFGADTAACLIEEGYCVDSSVTPFVDWHSADGGQDFVGAPLRVYRIDPGSGVVRSHPQGPLVEVPLTCGYTRLAPSSWQSLARFLARRPVRAAHLGGIGARVFGFRRAILSPEPHSVADMIALAKRVVESGVEHLHLFFHSSSLMPGLTPFASTSSDVERLYDRVEDFVQRVENLYEIEFKSVTEAAALEFPELVGAAFRRSDRHDVGTYQSNDVGKARPADIRRDSGRV